MWIARPSCRPSASGRNGCCAILPVVSASTSLLLPQGCPSRASTPQLLDGVVHQCCRSCKCVRPRVHPSHRALVPLRIQIEIKLRLTLSNRLRQHLRHSPCSRSHDGNDLPVATRASTPQPHSVPKLTVPTTRHKHRRLQQPRCASHVLEEGSKAPEELSEELGLGFDEWDLAFYTVIAKKLKRNPTDVECFDMAQSNSEHSRHWFFGGRLVIDGEEKTARFSSSLSRRSSMACRALQILMMASAMALAYRPAPTCRAS